MSKLIQFGISFIRLLVGAPSLREPPGTGPEWPLDNLSLLLETPKEQIPSEDDLPENQVMVLSCGLIGFNFFQC